MKSPKGIVVAILVLFGVSFVAFTTFKAKNDLTINQKQKLLATIGQLLENEHYSPQKINDSFSVKVFNKYLTDMWADDDKSIFLRKDIEALKKYSTTIDDEIHGAPIAFVPAVSAIYNTRVAETVELYQSILAHPFTFTSQDSIIINVDQLDFPGNEADKKERWYKKLKYITLNRFYDLQNQRQKTVVDSIKNKTDKQLEAEARQSVLRTENKIFERIKVKFNDDERFNLFLNTICNLMDPHTDYFPPIEKREFDEMMSNRFFGIGAQLTELDGNIKIVNIQNGGAAWKSGQLMANDIILKVGQGNAEPVDIAGYDVTDAVKLIRGDKGTEVRLTVKHPDGSIRVVSLIRSEVVLDESFARSLVINQNGKKIGYIYLPEFYADFERANGSRSSDDVAKEVKKLKEQNVDGIVLDLRFNGGGSLYEVVQMVGLFIGQGPVVQVRDKDGNSTVLTDRDNSVLYDGPLAVMINEGSASASEIFAAAIQDYKRGIIIGSRSYGKGTVQKNVPLGKPLDNFSGRTEYGAVKLTFQKFYRINGGSTQLKGVTPDVVIPDLYDYMKMREKDNPAALPWDEIAKVTYQTRQDNYDRNALIQKENAAIQANTIFDLINANTKWLAHKTDAPVQLNYEIFKKDQQKIIATAEQDNNLLKLKVPMNLQVPPSDKDMYYNNTDTAKGKRYQDWLKDRTRDMYIYQTAKVVAEMIDSGKAQTAMKQH
ncbi:carboxy terminal-processing peptidase [Hydrotalea sp.]|uniref:carboxy terminal-processing peptidase n=1 Tax=Hydrotalea sp. TaxID=2881279 RepID=UPI002628680A|nr:carboxy terminal-processing peptidase [Hydrotalea sp.]